MRRIRAVRAGARSALEEALARLTEVRSMVVVAAAALREQNADLDADIARLLRRSVADGIAEQIERLRRL
jgi:predicted MarR family transcription regulator